jgi:pimeloyl-ACP methyl ester carboxylesterase
MRTEATVRVGARDIFLTEAGAAAGATREIPLVLLHGGGPGATGASNYARNIDAFASAGYRVLVPDMPGYGRSTKELDHSDPFGDLALFVRGLLDALEVEKAHVVGNSYGGAAALRLALDRPDRVARLVLMGPGGIGTTRALPTKGLTALMSYYTGEGPSRGRSCARSSATTWSSIPLSCRRSCSSCATRRALIPRSWPTRRWAGRAGAARCGRCCGWTSPATGRAWRAVRCRPW